MLENEIQRFYQNLDVLKKLDNGRDGGSITNPAAAEMQRATHDIVPYRVRTITDVDGKRKRVVEPLFEGTPFESYDKRSQFFPSYSWETQ